MKIDFNNVTEQILENFKGGELHYDARIVDDGQNKIMSGKLVPGASIGMHIHDDSSEIIFITAGTATAITDNGTETLTAGMCHYCPKGTRHSLVNNGDTELTFMAVVPKQ